MTRASALVLDEVRLGYGGRTVVDRLSLTVQPGEILVLTGPSGCGKSTVLRALAGAAQARCGNHPRRRRDGGHHLARPSHGLPR